MIDEEELIHPSTDQRGGIGPSGHWSAARDWSIRPVVSGEGLFHPATGHRGWIGPLFHCSAGIGFPPFTGHDSRGEIGPRPSTAQREEIGLPVHRSAGRDGLPVLLSAGREWSTCSPFSGERFVRPSTNQREKVWSVLWSERRIGLPVHCSSRRHWSACPLFKGKKLVYRSTAHR